MALASITFSLVRQAAERALPVFVIYIYTSSQATITKSQFPFSAGFCSQQFANSKHANVDPPLELTVAGGLTP